MSALQYVLEGNVVAMKDVQPIELIQLCEKLHESFDGRIVGVGGGAKEKERNFLSKALAAWYLMAEAGATPEDAVAASIDGNNDHGIDSVFVGATDTVWLVQSKFINKGVGEPALGEVSKFKDGVCDLLRGKYERFNDELLEKRRTIDRVIESGQARCKVILLSTGSSFSDDRRAMMDDLENTLNEPANPRFVQFSNVGLATLHQVDLVLSQASSITLEIELENYGFVKEPRLSYYGSLGGQQIADMTKEYGQRLFSANIRQFKGNTVVNSGIERTLKAKPEDMFYFNNGVTFLCDDIQPFGYSSTNTRETGKFRLLGASVINGAQTVSCISKVAATASTEQAKVMVTVISKKDAPIGFSNEVTQFRNSQNMVSDIDFAALDENQQQWAMTLANSSVNYRYKGGLLDDETFNLEQAARALACAITSDGGLMLVAQVKTNGNRLFSRETGTVTASLYKTVFPDTLQARVLWRTVQICEEVRRVVRHDLQGEQGTDKSVLIHGGWMICHLVFCRLPVLKREESLALTSAERQRVEDTARQTAYQLITEYKNKFSSQSAESVFKNATDLSTLKGRVLAASAEPQV